MALTITRVVGERVFIGDDIVVSLVGVRGQHARLMIEAPKEVRIMREELLSPRPPTPPLLPLHAKRLVDLPANIPADSGDHPLTG